MKNSSQFTVHSSQTKNITKLLKRRLPTDILEIVQKVGRIAEDNGFSAYIVGGFVRDLLLGINNLDLDIVVEGNALKLVELLKKEMNLQVVRHERFATATVTFPGGFKIDIASARQEHYAHPAALPTVTLSSIKQDLYRRDFTVNTLAVRINPGDFGRHLDLFAAQRDLKQKKIRVLHEQSFIDDPTRVFRAIRYEQRYNFKIEPKTLRLLRRAIARGLLSRLSRFRLGREFILLLKEKKPLPAILRLEQLAGLRLIHPLIKLDKMVRARLKSHRATDDWLVHFALLTRKLNDQGLEQLCGQFCLTRNDKRRLKSLRSGEIVSR